MDFETLLAQLPRGVDRNALRASYQQSLKDGWSEQEFVQAAQQKYLTPRAPTATLPTAAADATRAVPTPPETPSALSGPLLALGLPVVGGAVGYGAIKGVQHGARATVRNLAQRDLQKAVAEVPGGVEELLRSLRGYEATGRGNNLTLSDLSPRLTAEADFVATKHPATATTLSELSRSRNQQRPPRLIADVERIAPGGYADPEGILQRIVKERQNWAAGPQGYGGLRAANPELSSAASNEVLGVITSPRVERAWRDAASVGAVGPLPEAGALSFEVLQDLNENLDRLASAAYARPGGGSLGARLAQAHTELTSALERGVPGYAQVSAKYKRYKDQENVVQSAQEWWRDPNLQLPELERRLAAIPEQDRWLVQRGMMGSYLADIENNAKNAGNFERLLTQLPVQQRKLEVAFGGAKQAQQALQTFEQERNLARLGSVGAGSQTAPRQAREAMSSSEMLGEAAHVLTHPVTGIPTVARRGVSKWVPGAVASEMAPYMAPRSAPEMEALLRLLGRLPK